MWSQSYATEIQRSVPWYVGLESSSLSSIKCKYIFLEPHDIWPDGKHNDNDNIIIDHHSNNYNINNIINNINNNTWY